MRALIFGLTLGVLAAPVLAAPLACPELATAVQVNGCPGEEELRFTFMSFCGDNGRMYAQDHEPCASYANYRKVKNLALWESRDGAFSGYLSCDVPAERLRALQPTSVKIDAKGAVRRVICQYPEDVTLTLRTRGNCRVENPEACTANAADCRIACD